MVFRIEDVGLLQGMNTVLCLQESVQLLLCVPDGSCIGLSAISICLLLEPNGELDSALLNKGGWKAAIQSSR
jgi:hypothetical protein